MSEDKRTARTKLPHGEGSVYPNPRSDGYIAEVTVAFDARGKRVVRRGYGKSETVAIKELRRKVKEYEDGLTVEAARYKVEDAVRDWLKYGQQDRRQHMGGLPVQLRTAPHPVPGKAPAARPDGD